ncbi:MAG: DUF1446 domain-containing protein [Gammaproteobacteria bacterium]|nr:DUF1446 domain-containing protein [Gammaproteobacteria bacterium]NND39569.1 DUF1446 domain-containing protein [Pseudomonadales bacterium]NNM12596.1 DUF1446 domain-containing protein [Pseudomonadales bacterium]
MSNNTLRIGGASGFWGDAAGATPQLLAAGGLDFIVYDYLAEITMSIMARARSKNPELGYAGDFVSASMKPHLAEIAKQGVRIVSNAGGVNPESCAAALRALIKEQGLSLTVACVVGDDLSDRAAEFADRKLREMFSGEDFPAPERLQSINAYLGAFPVAAALDTGADIVITGRCVDSAVTLGACIHHFGWQPDDLDQLAMGSLAGHILECGPQCTGGNFTDWETVADTIDSIGYPIAEVEANGEFVCTKPEGSGGVVNVGTVAEQMLYEIGDPQAYFLPDVVCDFSTARIEQVGDNRVKVFGAIGKAAPDTYKVCGTYFDKFRGGTYMSMYGANAGKRAEVLAEAVFKSARRELALRNMADFAETSVEIMGTECQYGKFSRVGEVREVVMKVAAKHDDAAGIGVLLKTATGLGLATPPGLSGFQGGRPKPSPVVRLFSFLLPKRDVSAGVEYNGQLTDCAVAQGTTFDPANIERPNVPQAPASTDTMVPLVKLAWARSGDKGDKGNVGVIARQARYLPYIWSALGVEVVGQRFAHFLEDTSAVERFLLPGCHAINFLMDSVLGGGGIASLRNDPQAKGYAQLLLEIDIPVPQAIADEVL